MAVVILPDGRKFRGPIQAGPGYGQHPVELKLSPEGETRNLYVYLDDRDILSIEAVRDCLRGNKSGPVR